MVWRYFLQISSKHQLNNLYQLLFIITDIFLTFNVLFYDQAVLGRNQQANVTFRFSCYPEYLRTGSTLLFRERATKGIGQVVKLYSYSNDDHVTSKRHCRSRGSSLSFEAFSDPDGTVSLPESSNPSNTDPISPKRQHIER